MQDELDSLKLFNTHIRGRSGGYKKDNLKTNGELVHMLRFMDDITILAETENDIENTLKI